MADIPCRRSSPCPSYRDQNGLSPMMVQRRITRTSFASSESGGAMQRAPVVPDETLTWRPAMGVDVLGLRDHLVERFDQRAALRIIHAFDRTRRGRRERSPCVRSADACARSDARPAALWPFAPPSTDPHRDAACVRSRNCGWRGVLRFLPSSRRANDHRRNTCPRIPFRPRSPARSPNTSWWPARCVPSRSHRCASRAYRGPGCLPLGFPSLSRLDSM